MKFLSGPKTIFWDHTYDYRGTGRSLFPFYMSIYGKRYEEKRLWIFDFPSRPEQKDERKRELV